MMWSLGKIAINWRLALVDSMIWEILTVSPTRVTIETSRLRDNVGIYTNDMRKVKVYPKYSLGIFSPCTAMTRWSQSPLQLPSLQFDESRSSSRSHSRETSDSSTSPLDPTTTSSRSLLLADGIAKNSSRLDDAVIAGLGLGHNNTDLPSSNGSASGSMILYRLTDPFLPRPHYQKRTTAIGSSSFLFPSQLKHRSYFADSTSTFTSTLDSRSPLTTPSALRGLVPYLYDPFLDSPHLTDDEDRLHDPTIKEDFRAEKRSFPWRGIINMIVLLGLISALLCLFILYPVWTFVRNRARNLNIYGNTRINGTGRAFLCRWLSG